ncbi:hypothetical protein IPL68_04570 [Candidatus Saccharibacteria bacterium]|nr:MAG: hypothetical protein IPL68_04570 [Candidatus Saccharibacteria bacterium]
MPKFQLPSWRPRKVHLPWQQMKPWLIGLGLMALVIVGGKLLLGKATMNKPNTVKTPVVVQTELGYKPVLPEVRAATETQPTKPNMTKNVSFTALMTRIRGKITVDRQSLPEKLTRKVK